MAMIPESFQLGYDIRSSLDELRERWTPDRRREYLLIPGTTYPLSVDHYVWPCVAPSPDHPLELWTRLAQAEQSTPAGGVIILIEILTPACAEYWRRNLEGWMEMEAESSVDKEFLGYDVADRDFVSGLSNCGLGSDEDARTTFASKLNSYGLFDDANFANQLAEYSNPRAPGHEPFCVYALYQVRHRLSGSS